MGGESPTTQVPAVITRILLSATLDTHSIESNTALLVLVLQTRDHSFLDLFDEAAVEYVAATNVRQLLLLDPMRVLLAKTDTVVIPEDISVIGATAVVSAPNSHLTMMAQVDKPNVAVPELQTSCTLSALQTTFNV